MRLLTKTFGAFFFCLISNLTFGQAAKLQLIDIQEIRNPDSLEKHLTPNNVGTYLFQLLTLENTWFLWRNEKFSSRLEEVRTIATKKDRKDALAIYKYLKGHADLNQGQQNRAFQFFREAYNGFEQLNDTSGLILTSLAQASLLVDLSTQNATKTEKSLEYGLSALNLAKTFGDTTLLLQSLVQLSSLYGLAGDLTKTKQVVEEVIRLTDNKPQYFLENLSIMNNYAMILLQEGNTEKAYRLMKDIKPKIQKHFQPRAYNVFLINFCQVCTELKYYSEAKVNLDELLESTRTNDNQRLLRADVFMVYKQLYERKGDPKTALIYADSVLAQKDRIYEFEKAQEISSLEAQYKSKDVTAENELLAKENALVRSRNIIALIAVAVGVLFIGILIVLLRKNIKKQHQLALQNEKISKLAGIRDQYIKIIAHDLRAPLFAMQGVYDVLKSIIKQRKFEDLDTVVTYVEESSNTTRILVDNMLNWGLSQQEEVGYQPEKIVLLDVIKHVVAEYDIVRSVKKCEIILACEPTISIYADPNGFQLILRNLLDNALKNVANAQGKVWIRAAPQVSTNTVTISITDNGRGIAPDKLADINTVFENHLNVQHQTNKLGLGILMISKFTNRNRGKIVATSLPNQGSTFELTLPLTN